MGLVRSVSDDVKQRINKSKNMVKGRSAEVLVEELFRILGYEVHRYGIEHAMPTLLRNLQDFRGHKIIDRVRALPDFIVTKGEGNRVYEIEVKYRETSDFQLSDVLDKYAAYEHVEALFIVVSPEALQCISFKELQANKKITPLSTHHLCDRPEFREEAAIIRYYAGYVRNVITKGLRDFSN